MTKIEAIKELVTETQKMRKAIKQLVHLQPDKFMGYEKGFTDASRKAISIMRKIGR